MYKGFYKKIISFVLICSFVAPAIFTSMPVKKAEALFGIGDVTFDPTNFVQNTITAIKSTATSIWQYAINYKEFTLDGIAWWIAKAIIRQITTSIVNWINSGFDGNPSFVTDPAGMFIDIADQEIGKFIEGSSDLNFLCQPFSIDIRIALAFKYSPFKQKITCTFSDVLRNSTNAANNFDNSFIKGNFEQGGWANWLSLTTEPQNNYIGAYVKAEEELAIRIGNHQASTKAEVDRGKGFLSWKKCVAYASNDVTKSNFYGPRAPGTEAGEQGFIGPLPEASKAETGKGACAREETQTPGTVIESGLENVMGSGIRQLELADEFNEIINALFAQLVKTAITSAAGLKGTSGKGPYDGTSYINRVETEQSEQEKQVLANIQKETNTGITTAITEETTYYQNKNTALTAINETKELFIKAQTCYQTKITTPQVPPLTSSEIAVAESRISAIGDTINKTINPVAGPIAIDLAASSALLTQLNSFKSKVDAAKTINELTEATTVYNKFIQDRVLHETPSVVQSGVDKDDVVAQMNGLKTQANTAQQQCNAFPAGIGLRN